MINETTDPKSNWNIPSYPKVGTFQSYHSRGQEIIATISKKF